MAWAASGSAAPRPAGGQASRPLQHPGNQGITAALWVPFAQGWGPLLTWDTAPPWAECLLEWRGVGASTSDPRVAWRGTGSCPPVSQPSCGAGSLFSAPHPAFPVHLSCFAFGYPVLCKPLEYALHREGWLPRSQVPRGKGRERVKCKEDSWVGASMREGLGGEERKCSSSFTPTGWLVGPPE